VFSSLTIPTTHLAISFIVIGANDSVLEHSPQYVPIDKFKANLEHLIAMVHDSTSEYYSPHTRILLLTPPPVGEAQRNADLASRNPPKQPDREWNNTKAYADAVKEVGKGKPKVGIVDIWEAIWGAAGKDVAGLPEFLSDGLHLTVAGYEVSKF
jgi:lysophospholipase L1-like esterase